MYHIPDGKENANKDEEHNGLVATTVFHAIEEGNQQQSEDGFEEELFSCDEVDDSYSELYGHEYFNDSFKGLSSFSWRNYFLT